MSDQANDPTRSSYDRSYWLRRCETFLVKRSNEPDALEVRTGLFRRTRLLIGVDDITEIDPERGVLTLANPPRAL